MDHDTNEAAELAKNRPFRWHRYLNLIRLFAAGVDVADAAAAAAAAAAAD